MPKIKREAEKPKEQELNALFDSLDETPPPQEERIDIPREELVAYKTFKVPSMETPIEVRKLKYSEIKQLHNLEDQDSNEVYDKIILACTNLTIQSLELMPLLERKYFLLFIRSISFVDTKFTIVVPCKADGCEREREIDIAIEELDFIEPPPEFYEQKTIEVGSDVYKVVYGEELYRDEKILSEMKYDSDSENDISNVIAVVESIELNGKEIYTKPNELTGYLKAVDVFEEHGHLTQWILEDLDRYEYGIAPLKRGWQCKCQHQNETVLDADTFFFLAQI